jgi:hypothetical protein
MLYGRSARTNSKANLGKKNRISNYFKQENHFFPTKKMKFKFRKLNYYQYFCMK